MSFKVTFLHEVEECFEDQLNQLQRRGRACQRDAAKILRVLLKWQAAGLTNCSELKLKPIEGTGRHKKKKLWEASYGKTTRQDGVYGYRFFYTLCRDPHTEDQYAVLLYLYAKTNSSTGKSTPESVINEARRRLEIATGLVEKGLLPGEDPRTPDDL